MSPRIIGGFGPILSSAPFRQADLAVLDEDTGRVARIRCEESPTTIVAIIEREDWADLVAAGEGFPWPEVAYDPCSSFSFWIFGPDYVDRRRAVEAVAYEWREIGWMDVCMVDVRVHSAAATGTSWRERNMLFTFDQGVSLLRSGRASEALIRAKMANGLSPRMLGRTQALLVACHRALGDHVRADWFLCVAANRSRGFMHVTEEWLAWFADGVGRPRDEHPDYELVDTYAKPLGDE
jgi:hypothetical protein